MHASPWVRSLLFDLMSVLVQVSVIHVHLEAMPE